MSAPQDDQVDPVSWAVARRSVALEDLWRAVERGDKRGGHGKVLVHREDVRLVLEELGDYAAAPDVPELWFSPSVGVLEPDTLGAWRTTGDGVHVETLPADAARLIAAPRTAS